jgi:hypothetical protein
MRNTAVTIELGKDGVRLISASVRNATEQKDAAKFLEEIAEAVSNLSQAAKNSGRAKSTPDPKSV